MVDITKDEFWENKYEEVNKEDKKSSRLKEIIKKHKIITASIIILSMCMIANIILLYNFFNLLSEL